MLLQKLLTFFGTNISIYAIFNDQSINDTLTNDIVIFEQLGTVDYPLVLMNFISSIYISVQLYQSTLYL